MVRNPSADLARAARALGYDARVDLLRLLLKNDSTVSDLADRLALDQPRASSHLAALRAAGLVLAHSAGRQRLYHVDAERIGPLLDALDAVAEQSHSAADQPPPRSRQASQLVTRDAPLRQARTCYDHLAGVAGVQLLDGLLERAWLVRDQPGRRTVYSVSPTGQAELGKRGVDLPAARRARRMFAFACIDWTERRPHLGGALGGAILGALSAAGIAARPGADGGRSVALARPIEAWLAPG